MGGMMIKGLMGRDPLDDMEVLPEIVDEAENKKNMDQVKRNWNLGPEKASAKPGDNTEYWSHMAEVWSVEEDEARRKMCANCEYFENTPMMMEAMEEIPFNDFDADGGGRGYCHKFDFICHNLRTCQAWEKKQYYKPFDCDED